MEQANSKHGRAHDESLKQETQGLIRAGRSTHAEGWRDPELLDDEPTPLTGGVPPGMTQRDVEDRSTLASHLGQAVYPADRDTLIGRLATNDAPAELVERVAGLPGDRTYRNVQELAVDLGLAVESKRF